MIRSPIPFGVPKKLAMWLCSAALFFQVLSPLTPALANAILADNANVVVICTPSGFVKMVVTDDGSLSGLPSTPAQSSACEFCQICHFANNGSGLLPHMQAVVVMPTGFPLPKPVLIVRTTGPNPYLLKRPSQAPPVWFTPAS
jgi:Protein of unknown function (DUF2946)